MSERSYLTEGYTLGSWLSTHDHKRIAILFAVAITGFFFVVVVALVVVAPLLPPPPELLPRD